MRHPACFEKLQCSLVIAHQCARVIPDTPPYSYLHVVLQVLAYELDEDYFHHTHMKLRQHLQQLATQSLLSSPHAELSQHLEQQQRPVQWEDCCSKILQKEQLQQLLRVWAAERHQLLSQQCPAEPQQLEQWLQDCELAVQLHCGSGEW